MSRSGTSSKFRFAVGVTVLALSMFGGAGGGPVAAKVFLSTDEALRLAFPNAVVEKRTAFLKPEELARARHESGIEITSAVVVQHVALREGRLLGTAYFETHRVRTLPETVLIVVDPAGKIARIEIISFREPEDYLPRAAWYAQFLGRGLDAELKLDRAIRPVTGATLTATATVAAVRRTLAIHRVSQGKKP
jgi:FMN-binding domain